MKKTIWSKKDSIIKKALFFTWLIKVLLKYTYIVCNGIYAYAAIIIYLVHSNLSVSMDRGCQFSFPAKLANFTLRVRSAFCGMKSEEGDRSNKNGVSGKMERLMVSIIIQTWKKWKTLKNVTLTIYRKYFCKAMFTASKKTRPNATVPTAKAFYLEWIY